MMFLMDENARPLPEDLKLWVNIVKYIKRGAPGGALSFFTYMELSTFHYSFPGKMGLGLNAFTSIAIWVVTFMFFRPERLKWYVSFRWNKSHNGRRRGAYYEVSEL